MNYPLIKPGYYASLLKEIVAFIRKPTLNENREKTTRIKVYDTIGLYILKMIFLIPLVLFFAVVYDPENIQGASMSDRFSPLVFLLVGGFILPFVEEIAFRLSLRFKPLYLALSSSVFTYYILTKLVFSTKISAVDESFVLRVGIALLVGISLYPIINITKVKEKLDLFWSKYFRVIYYLSCIIFAWIHITKYELILLNIVLLPILTLPQLMSALINGYTRVTFGFQYPLLFHISNNLIGIGLSLLPFTDMIF